MAVMNEEELENELLQYPVLQFAFLKTKDIQFLEQVRQVCRNECPRYGTSWSCPPAVGTVSQCRERANTFPDCFVFSTVAEVEDITNLDQTLPTRAAHEEVTRQINGIFRKHFGRTLVLSTDSCDICPHCAYLDGLPCRHPDQMFPCVESYGILVTDLAAQGSLEFNNGANVVTWFSVIFFDADKWKDTADVSGNK